MTETCSHRSQRRIGPAARAKGQRESLRIAVAALACLAASAAPAGEAFRVETPAPVLDVAAGHGIIVASLGLEGVSWLPVTKPEAIRSRSDWPTLSALPLDGGRFLLCGRDLAARVVRFDAATGDLALDFSWQVESLPNEAVIFGERGDHLAMACGGGGLLVWNWSDRNAPPALVGRYPFIGFARTVVPAGESTLVVADAHDYGMMTIDVRDPLRPRKLGNVVVRGYCDDVAFDGESIWFVNRLFGTDQVRADAAFAQFEVLAHHDPLVPRNEDYRAASVVATGDTLLISELMSGVRVFRRTDGKWHRVATVKAAHVAVEAVPLPDGRIAIGDLSGAVVLAPVEP